MKYSKAIENERDTNRVEAFSDGVIAVAITLLVLDIHVPTLETNLIRALLYMWPAYLGYVMSFMVIGLFWSNHHYMFKYIERTDHYLLLLNIFALMCLVFLPFATALFSEYVQHGEKYIAMLIYSASLLLTSISFNFVWWYASRKQHLLEKDVDPYVYQALTRRNLLSLPLYGLTIFFSLFSIEVTFALYICIAILYALPMRRFRWKKQQDTSSIADISV